MSRFLVALVVALSAIPASAANTQVSASSFKAAGKTGYVYGRSDGVFQEATTASPYMIENGTSAGPIGKGFRETFPYADGDGLYCSDVDGFGACAGNTALTPCVCETGSGMRFNWLPLTTQDIPPDQDAASLDIGGDQTDNDGAMLVWGVGRASGRPFKIGADPAFYMCATVAVADITGIDQNIMAGFVAATSEVWNADFEALDAYAGIGVLGTAAAGVTAEDITIKTETDAAQDGTGDGVTTTDTTDDATEGVAYKYCTYVSSAGAVTYTVNGSAPTVTAAFSFATGIEVVPFMTYLHTNDVAGEIDVTLVEVGYQQ